MCAKRWLVAACGRLLLKKMKLKKKTTNVWATIVKWVTCNCVCVHNQDYSNQMSLKRIPSVHKQCAHHNCICFVKLIQKDLLRRARVVKTCRPQQDGKAAGKNVMCNTVVGMCMTLHAASSIFKIWKVWHHAAEKTLNYGSAYCPTQDVIARSSNLGELDKLHLCLKMQAMGVK